MHCIHEYLMRCLWIFFFLRTECALSSWVGQWVRSHGIGEAVYKGFKHTKRQILSFLLWNPAKFLGLIQMETS